MKKLHFLSLASLLIFGWGSQGEAIPIKFEGPSARIISSRQPIEVIITDSQGHFYQQTIPYNPAIGGVDINIGELGPHASIYFPELEIGFIWYNGYWVNEAGYYWDGHERVYIKDPQWKNYWTHYWQGPRYDKMRRAPWHQRRFDNRSRYEEQYQNRSSYPYYGHDSSHYRESNDRQRGRWQEERKMDPRDQNNWRKENQWNNRGNENQQTWRNQRDFRQAQRNWRDQSMKQNWNQSYPSRATHDGQDRWPDQSYQQSWGSSQHYEQWNDRSPKSHGDSPASIGLPQNSPSSINRNPNRTNEQHPYSHQTNKVVYDQDSKEWKQGDGFIKNDEKQLSWQEDKKNKTQRWERRHWSQEELEQKQQ